jgi:hypothetical protein
MEPQDKPTNNITPMKKLFLTLTIVATVCLMTSCFGGGGSAGLVGTWGLTHFEWYEYEDGELVDSESGDVDPDSPIGYDDLKWEISHVDGNDYLFTIYDYNKSKKEWEVDGKQTITIENGKATFDDNETATFKVSGNTLNVTTEYSEEYEGVLYSERVKMTFKRLSAPETNTNTNTNIPDVF